MRPYLDEWLENGMAMAKYGHDPISIREKLPDGSLTKASMLYEGSFEEWWSHLQAIWRIQLRDMQWDDPPQSNLQRHWHTGPTSLAEIYHSVCPNLLRRVPSAAFQSVATLIAALEIASQPFRLMDLPTEIRLRIFEYSSLDLRFWVNNGCEWSHSQLPALTACSRHLRQEVLPLIGMKLEITSDVNMFDGETYPAFDAFRTQLRVWSSKQGSRIVKGMSRLTISFSATDYCSAGANFEISLILRARKGLFRQWNTGYLNGKMLKEVDAKVADLETQRRAQGMHGEVLILLITDAFDKWVSLRPEIDESGYDWDFS
jgi:hypothetical protein